MTNRIKNHESSVLYQNPMSDLSSLTLFILGSIFWSMTC